MPKISAGPKKILFNGVEVGEVMSTGDLDKDADSVVQFLKSKGLHKETSIFQAMFSQALAFANTSAYLYERDLRATPRKGTNIAPFIVNAAFSIELYLKALAQKHGVSLHGHELVTLYEALPNNALHEIQSVLTRCAAKRSLGEEPNFPAYIAGLNRAFIDWRYCYEKQKLGSIGIEPIIFVMEVLHESCRLPPAA